MPLLLIALGVGAVGLFTGVIWGPVGEAAKALAHVADAVVQQLPDAGDLGLSVEGGWLRGYAILNTFLPLSEALAMVTVMVGIYVAVVTARLAVTVWHLIPKPGIGT